MKNKTAIEMLIDIIKEKRKESDISNTLLRFCQVEAEKLLPKEREQMRLFFNRGNDFGHYEDFDDYYETTFKK